jgi:hypothetical protein
MMDFQYKERSFLLKPLKDKHSLLVINAETQEVILQCNFPTKGKHALDLAKKGVDEDQELINGVQGFIRVLVDQGRI